MPNKENECLTCNSYELFKSLVKNGVSIEEAYFHSIEELVNDFEEVIETVEFIEQKNHYEGFREGFTAGMRAVAEQAVATAEKLEDADDEDDCDCEFCQPQSECDNCDCADGVCEVDIENRIRRSILEDEK